MLDIGLGIIGCGTRPMSGYLLSPLIGSKQHFIKGQEGMNSESTLGPFFSTTACRNLRFNTWGMQL
jgi:hypothetical protein